MASDSSSGLWPGVSHISLQIRKAQPRGGRKRSNERTRTWVSSKRKKGSLWHCAFSMHLKTIAGVYFAWNFYKSHKQCWHLLALFNPASVGQQVLAVTFITSVDSLLCPASICSLPPSADCLILWTAISSRLVSRQRRVETLRCRLTLSLSLPLSLSLSLSLSSLGPSFPRPLLVSRETSSSVLCVGFAPKQRVCVAPTQTETNCYASCHMG